MEVDQEDADFSCRSRDGRERGGGQGVMAADKSGGVELGESSGAFFREFSHWETDVGEDSRGNRPGMEGGFDEGRAERGPAAGKGF